MSNPIKAVGGGVFIIALIALIALLSLVLGGIMGYVVALIYNAVFGAGLSTLKFAAIGSIVSLIGGASATSE